MMDDDERCRPVGTALVMGQKDPEANSFNADKRGKWSLLTGIYKVIVNGWKLQ
jgi:hypothetical protein